MKKNLLIKLNDVVIETSSCYNNAVRKSLEFFLGKLIGEKEIKDFRERKCPATNTDCVRMFLNENNSFLMDKAIIKKFNEYYFGKDFNGLIKDSRLIVDKKKLGKLSSKFNVVLLCLMPQEEANYFFNKFGMQKLKKIVANFPKEGIQKAKQEIKGEIAYAGNTILDYNAAVGENVSFFGMNMKAAEIPKGKAIKKLEEIK
jgi:hypothetical protein